MGTKALVGVDAPVNPSASPNVSASQPTDNLTTDRPKRKIVPTERGELDGE
jgi:hypothetical protein